MKTPYLTDRFSTLGGLGSVAYGDPEYFREVQNQIYAQSPTRFIDAQRPSDVFESLVLDREKFRQSFINVLEVEYLQNGSFTDYIDINYGPGWKNSVSRDAFPVLQRELDSSTFYGNTSSTYMGQVVNSLFPGFEESEKLIQNAVSEINKNSVSSTGADLGFFSVSNNPQTKISTPPPESIIALENSVDLGLDYRGVSFTTGYSTLEDYWSNIPYPGITGNNLIPATMKESVLNGYVGYSSQIPLEALYNPIGADSIGNSNINPGDSFNFSGSATGGGSILAQFSQEFERDPSIYQISLIGETLNGYTTFDPQTMSNGDLFDASLVPNFEAQNADPDGGRAGLSRTFSPIF